MAMTREEMRKLASYGRGGDTMLAHINPEEAALLKARGGSGTINPDTGLPEYWGIKSFTKPLKQAAKVVQQVAAPIVKPVEKAVSQVSSNLANLPGSVENTVKQVAANPITQVALIYYMPTIASYLGPYLTAVPAAYQTAVASALASTALQVAQGVPLKDALQSAAVNATVNTGAPQVSTYITSLGATPQVADALTSIGASAAKTAANGGSKDDIERNMLGALTGSTMTSALQEANTSPDVSRVFGATAGGAVVGGTSGAISGAAGELGSQASRDEAAKNKALEDAKKGIASADTGIVSDSGKQLGEVVVTGKKETDPTVQDTNIILSDGSIKPKTTPTTAPVTPTPTTVSPEQPILDLIASTPPIAEPVTPSLAPVTVTSPKEPTSIQDTDIILPETTVKGTPETDVSSQEGKPPVDEQGKYKPNLFIYGGTTLGSSLKTQAPFYPVAGTTGGLTSTRGAGEIESKETGKKRKNVWNEESLRLKDALGV